MYNDIDKALKETHRKVLELEIEKAIRDGDLVDQYVKLRKKYNHKDTIAIIADLAEAERGIL